MRVLSAKPSEDCFIKDMKFQYILSSPIDAEYVDYLCRMGVKKAGKDFKGSFFDIDFPNLFRLKGIIGLNELRIVFRPGSDDSMRKLALEILEASSEKDEESASKKIKSLARNK